MFTAGRYRLKITGQGFDESKEKKTPFFFLEGIPIALIGEDGQDYDPDNPKEYTRIVTLYITQKTIDRVTEDLRKLGWPGGRLATLDPSTPNHHSMVGNEIEVTCAHEAGMKGDGKMIEKWELPYEGKSQDPKQSNATIASKLDKLYGGKLPKPAAKAPARKAVTTPATDDMPDDSVPF